MTRERGPSDLSPGEAFHRYVDWRRTEVTAGSAETYHYRLKLWAEWCEDEGIESVSEFSGWTFERFESARSGARLAASTLHNEMETLKSHVEYLKRIEAVDDGLSKKVNVPKVPEDERSRDTMLTTDSAVALLRYYRSSDVSGDYGTRFHALLELAWHSGARLGAIRGLDLRDYDSGNECVEFVHRPETDTPLKNKKNGERVVGLRRPVCDAIDTYIRHHRWDGHDEHGRQPLFVTIQKRRASPAAIRAWAYQATFPCVYGPCPHGHDPRDCEFRSHSKASRCPSSRAPHHIRTGSITFHRDRGFPRDETRERVDASEDVIDEYYDKANAVERMELRRRQYVDILSIE